MNKISIETNIIKFINKIDNFEKTFKTRVAQKTTNNLAFDSMQVLRNKIDSRFNGKKMSDAVRFKKATNSRPYAEIYISDYYRWKENALTTLGLGGDRARKSIERLLKRGGYLKRDEILISDGEVSGGVYTKISSQLQLFYKAGFDANETSSSRKKNQGRKGITSRFFIVTSEGYAFTNDLGKIKKRKSGLAPGIYVLAYDKVSGTTGEKVWRRLNNKPIRLLKIGKKPKYTKSFDISEIVREVKQERGEQHFQEALQYAKKDFYK